MPALLNRAYRASTGTPSPQPSPAAFTRAACPLLVQPKEFSCPHP